MNIRRILLLSLYSLLIHGCDTPTRSSDIFHYPDKEWMQYTNLNDAGWDTCIIDKSVKFADSINTAAFMLLEDGVIVKAYGDISRRYMCHSVRKSLLSALYGIYVENGMIDTSKTMYELGVDDIGMLTDTEKQAKIIDLLKSRSGIFHPAAYETPYMASSRPKRESHLPNTFWYYNNWDFNTLGHIFKIETGEDIFEAFDTQIAKPIKMQDYEPHHGYYHLESEHSQFPAYPFRLSTRDMARFGLLFEREGNWNGKQIIAKDWIKRSTIPYSTNLGNYSGSGYGFMWWLLEKDFDEYGGGYTALGVGQQTITVLPEQNIVFIHRTNTYENNRVSRSNTVKLLKLLLSAKENNPISTPKLEKHTLPQKQKKDYTRFQNKEAITGQHVYSSGIEFEIIESENGLRLIDERMGNYNLLFTSDSSFLLEDRNEPFYIISRNDKPWLISERIVNREAYYLLNTNRINEAIDLLKLNTMYFPESFNTYDSMGEALLIAGDTLDAVKYYKQSITLNENNTVAIWLLMKLNIDGFKRHQISNEDIARYTGTYKIGSQTLNLQAVKNKLYIVNQRGDYETELIPITKEKFIVSTGNHNIFDFGICTKGLEFNVINREGIIGKLVKCQSNKES